MTSRIVQRVAPRKRHGGGGVAIRTGAGWRLRHFGSGRQHTSVWPARRWSWQAAGAQRGSVTSSTVTVGFAIVSLVTVALLGFLYLSQVFGTASRGTNVQDLETQIVELKERQRELELEGAESRSIQAVEERVQQLNLTATDSVAYLPLQPERVALEQAPLSDI